MTDHNTQNGKVVKQTFTNVKRFTLSSTVASVNIDPVNSTSLFGSQVANMANLYQEFRCVGIKITLMPNPTDAGATGNTSTFLIIGHVPVESSSAPASATDVSQLSDVAVLTSGHSYPVTFRLNRKLLLSMRLQRWFHIDTTPNVTTDMQGALYYVASGTNSTTWVSTWLIQSMWEFRAPVPFGLFAKIAARIEDQKELEGPTIDDPPGISQPQASDPKYALTPEDFALLASLKAKSVK